MMKAVNESWSSTIFPNPNTSERRITPESWGLDFLKTNLKLNRKFNNCEYEDHILPCVR